MNPFNYLHRKIVSNLTMSVRSAFVRNARSLESIKNGEIPAQSFENGKFLVIIEESNLVLLNQESKKISWKDAEALRQWSNVSTTVILDVVKQEPELCLFAISLPVVKTDEINDVSSELGGFFCNMRKALFYLDQQECRLLSQARGLLNFNRLTKFCKFCGTALDNRPAGTQKFCPSCKKVHYPSISPVGIVLIENETHEKVLLARGVRHPEGMYSCLAGFMEPGETLEENLRREVAEEVGLDINNLEYVSSQHWAMPESQLMLGCIATACSEDFELDPVELVDGKWIDVETLKSALNRAKSLSKMPEAPNGEIWVPPPFAVAHTLMEVWLKKYHGYVSPVTSRI